MAQQIFAGMPFGGRGFSSASAMGGLGGHRTYVASVGHPMGNGYGVGCFSSKSLSNLGGSKRISYGSYGGYGGAGSGCYGVYGAYGYGHMGYGTMGFGGRMGHTGNGGLVGGYSSFRGDSIRGVTINEKLLKPLHVGVDPQEHEARNQEREEMKTLNDQFACFIDKVRYLEQQNKVLETKWSLLQECALPARKNLEPYYENFISNMKKQLDCMLNERDHLTSEEASIQQLVEDFKSGYEEELKRRTAAENEFVLLKKDVDSIFLSKAELEGKLDLLSRELEFRKCVHAEELAQLDCHVGDTNVLLQMDNSRNIDADLIIKNIDAWYQSIVQRSKEEANAVYESRFLELQQQRGKYSDDLKINQHAIADLTRLLNKMQSEHDIVKKQVDCLQSSIIDVEQRGDVALKDAREKQTELQTALQKAKDDLARLLKDYHDLLNTKLALDIEIATYKTLLEGEESRIYTGNFVSIDVKPPYTEDAIGYAAPCAYRPIGIDYGTDFSRIGCGRCRRRGSYSGGCSGGRSDGGYGRRRSWSSGCGIGYGGALGGSSGRGYGGSSGGGYSGGGGEGYGGSSGGGYSGRGGGGYGGSSGGGYSGGGGYGGSSGGGEGGRGGGGYGGSCSGGYSSGGGGGYGRSSGGGYSSGGGGGYGGSSGGGYSGGGGGGYGGSSGGGYGGSSGGGYGGRGGGGYGGSSGGGGGGCGGSSGGGYCGGGGYGGSSGRGYSSGGGGGDGGSSGGGYSGGSGGGYGRRRSWSGEYKERNRGMMGGGCSGGSGQGGMSGGGYSGGGYGGEYSGGSRSSRRGENYTRSSTCGGQGSGYAQYSGRGYSSRSAQGSASNIGTQCVSGGLMGSSTGGGWASAGYQQVGGIPYGSEFVSNMVGSPIIVGGVGGGVDVECIPAVGMSAVGFPPVGVPAVSIGGIGIERGSYVEVIPPLV